VVRAKFYRAMYVCAYLGYLTQSPTLLSEINDHATSAILCLLYSLFDTKNQVGAACANVRSKDIASITLKKSEHFLIINDMIPHLIVYA